MPGKKHNQTCQTGRNAMSAADPLQHDLQAQKISPDVMWLIVRWYKNSFTEGRLYLSEIH